jgi:hypothetical protein
MTDWQLILFGVALGAVPSAQLGRIASAWLAKRAGLAPAEIAQYSEATDGDDDTPQ